MTHNAPAPHLFEHSLLRSASATRALTHGAMAACAT